MKSVIQKFAFKPDTRIVRKHQTVSLFYVVQSGGVVLKHNDADEICMTGDFVDPLSLITNRASGDTYSIGTTMLIGGTASDIKDYMISSPELLSRTLVQAARYFRKRFGHLESNTLVDLDSVISDLVGRKQKFVSKYPPILFGEKALYRKGVKFLEMKEAEQASGTFAEYLEQFSNSPLARPVRMYFALSRILSRAYESAAEIMMTVLAENSADVVAKHIHRVMGVLGLRDTRVLFLKGFMKYPEDFFSMLPLEPRVVSLKFEKDQVVLEEEKNADRIAFVVSGRAGIIKKSKDGAFLLSELKSDCSFGEVHALSGSLWDVTLIARSESRIILVSEEVFLKMVTARFPRIGLSLLEYILAVCGDGSIPAP